MKKNLGGKKKEIPFKFCAYLHHDCMTVLYLYDLNLLIFEGHFHESFFLIFCSIVTMALSIFIFRI